MARRDAAAQTARNAAKKMKRRKPHAAINQKGGAANQNPNAVQNKKRKNTMKIEILGTGCSKCKALEEAAKQAVAQSGKFAQIEKVEDIMKIMEYGVMSTPGLVIDGKVVSTGKLLSVQEIVDLIKAS
jgi:small redox-active disulfide protein 2